MIEVSGRESLPDILDSETNAREQILAALRKRPGPNMPTSLREGIAKDIHSSVIDDWFPALSHKDQLDVIRALQEGGATRQRIHHFELMATSSPVAGESGEPASPNKKGLLEALKRTGAKVGPGAATFASGTASALRRGAEIGGPLAVKGGHLAAKAGAKVGHGTASALRKGAEIGGPLLAKGARGTGEAIGSLTTRAGQELQKRLRRKEIILFNAALDAVAPGLSESQKEQARNGIIQFGTTDVIDARTIKRAERLIWAAEERADRAFAQGIAKRTWRLGGVPDARRKEIEENVFHTLRDDEGTLPKDVRDLGPRSVEGEIERYRDSKKRDANTLAILGTMKGEIMSRPFGNEDFVDSVNTATGEAATGEKEDNVPVAPEVPEEERESAKQKKAVEDFLREPMVDNREKEIKLNDKEKSELGSRLPAILDEPFDSHRREKLVKNLYGEIRPEVAFAVSEFLRKEAEKQAMRIAELQELVARLEARISALENGSGSVAASQVMSQPVGQPAGMPTEPHVGQAGQVNYNYNYPPQGYMPPMPQAMPVMPAAPAMTQPAAPAAPAGAAAGEAPVTTPMVEGEKKIGEGIEVPPADAAARLGALGAQEKIIYRTVDEQLQLDKRGQSFWRKAAGVVANVLLYGGVGVGAKMAIGAGVLAGIGLTTPVWAVAAAIPATAIVGGAVSAGIARWRAGREEKLARTLAEREQRTYSDGSKIELIKTRERMMRKVTFGALIGGVSAGVGAMAADQIAHFATETWEKGSTWISGMYETITSAAERAEDAANVATGAMNASVYAAEDSIQAASLAVEAAGQAETAMQASAAAHQAALDAAQQSSFSAVDAARSAGIAEAMARTAENAADAAQDAVQAAQAVPPVEAPVSVPTDVPATAPVDVPPVAPAASDAMPAVADSIADAVPDISDALRDALIQPATVRGVWGAAENLWEAAGFEGSTLTWLTDALEDYAQDGLTPEANGMMRKSSYFAEGIIGKLTDGAANTSANIPAGANINWKAFFGDEALRANLLERAGRGVMPQSAFEKLTQVVNNLATASA